MDPTALNTFSTVARLGSVSAAALELHTVQSNVTARLKQLEGDLGVALFQRHSRGVTLTGAGSRLLVYAQRLGALADEARAAVRDDGASVRGSLQIGSMESTAAVRLPGLLGPFHQAHPEVQLEVRTGPTAELLEQVLSHRLDGALVAAPIEHPELETLPVFREELVLVRALGSAAPAERLRTSAAGLTAIMFRQGCSYRQRLEEQFATRGWLPFRRLEFGTLEGMLGCVGANIGVTLLPRSVVEGYGGRAQLHVEPPGPRPLWVDTLFVRRRDAHLGTTLRAFIDAMRPAPPAQS